MRQCKELLPVAPPEGEDVVPQFAGSTAVSKP